MSGKFKLFACKSCTELLKKEYGCVNNAVNPVFELECLRCQGNDNNCEICKGSGKELFYRCPAKLITKKTAEVIKYYKHYQNGYLPVAGGIRDQSVTFIKAIEILEHSINRMAEDK